jgi:hypothetical protein
VTIHDTGHGMESAILEHIFELCFTTKGVGEGTGLGRLSFVASSPTMVEPLRCIVRPEREQPLPSIYLKATGFYV